MSNLKKIHLAIKSAIAENDLSAGVTSPGMLRDREGNEYLVAEGHVNCREHIVACLDAVEAEYLSRITEEGCFSFKVTASRVPSRIDEKYAISGDDINVLKTIRQIVLDNEILTLSDRLLVAKYVGEVIESSTHIVPEEMSTCPGCNGEGGTWFDGPCTLCEGALKIPTSKAREVIAHMMLSTHVMQSSDRCGCDACAHHKHMLKIERENREEDMPW